MSYTIEVENLPNNLMGIYKINYPNGKIYIGLSTNIKRRLREHNCNTHENLQPCDAAIKKYGKITKIEILEEIQNKEQLEEREKQWINYYQSNNREKGYNLTPGGNGFYACGEDSYNATFSNKEVLDIRKRRYNGERKKDVYKDQSDRNFKTFENIWWGRNYTNVGNEYIIPTGNKTRAEYSSEANKGLKNGRAKATLKDILDIRQRYEQGETLSSISKDYIFRLSKSTIRRIALKEVFTNV